MVGKRVVCSHRPRICGNIVNLDVIIGADSGARDPVDFPIEVGRGVEVGGDGIRGQARVIGIADRVVAPKRGSRIEVLVLAAKQVDVGAVADRGQPVASGGQGSNRAPAISHGHVLVNVCGGDVVEDAAEAIDVPAY